MARRDVSNETEEETKERKREYMRKWRAKPENLEKHRARNRAYMKAHKKEHNEYQKKYYKNNKAKIKAQVKVRHEKDPEKARARLAKYRASKLDRTPRWLTKDDWKVMNDYYKVATMLSEITGTPYEVDHIVPLQGKLVSGLHCPTNLDVIPKSENCTKSNKFDIERVC